MTLTTSQSPLHLAVAVGIVGVNENHSSHKIKVHYQETGLIVSGFKEREYSSPELCMGVQCVCEFSV